jgi:uncharacterized membrane protein
MRLFNVRKIKDSYAEKGIFNPKEQIANALNDPIYGIRIMFAGAAMNILTLLLLFGVYNLFKVLGVLQKGKLSITAIIIIILTSLAVNYFLIFKDDSYLDCFKEYDEMKKKSRIKNFIISILVCILIFSFSVLMFLAT